jgi:hypothetical protein
LKETDYSGNTGVDKREKIKIDLHEIVLARIGFMWPGRDQWKQKIIKNL